MDAQNNQLNPRTQPKPLANGFVRSSLTDQAFLALAAETDYRYVDKIVGPKNLKFQTEASAYISHEARYFNNLAGQAPDGATVLGVWVVISQVDQAKLQALTRGAHVNQGYQVLRSDGAVFTQRLFDLVGEGERARILHVANVVHEDPLGAEKDSSMVLMSFSRSGGTLPLDGVVIHARHGQIVQLSYAMEGLDDSSVLAYLRARVKIKAALSAEESAKLISAARETLVEGTYVGNQAALQYLIQDQKVAEAGFNIVGLPDYRMEWNAKDAKIVLIGKDEPIAMPWFSSELVLHEKGMQSQGVVVRSALTLPEGGEGPWRVRFGIPQPEEGLRCGGKPVGWVYEQEETVLQGFCEGKNVIRLEIVSQGAVPVIKATLEAALDHLPDSNELSRAINLVLFTKQRAVPGLLNLRMIDDQPSIEVSQLVDTPARIDTNLMVLLDSACGMRARMADRTYLPAEGEPSRLQVAKTFITQLINQYAERGQVKLHFVLYDQEVATGWDANGTTHQSMAWLSAQDALAMLNNGGLEQRIAYSHPAANYDLALSTAAGVFSHPDQLAGTQVQNKLLFISGGLPQQMPSSDTLQTFHKECQAQQIQVRTLGIGDHLDGYNSHQTRALLESIATDNAAGRGKLAQQLIDPSKLTEMLPDGLAATGASALFDGGLGQFGADGGYVCEIRFAGQVYSWDRQSNALNGYRDTDWHPAQANWQWRFDPVNATLHFRSGSDQLALDLLHAQYRYRSYRAQPDRALQLDFKLVDGDGDQALGRLELKAGSAAVSLMNAPNLAAPEGSAAASDADHDPERHPQGESWFYGSPGQTVFTWNRSQLQHNVVDRVFDFKLEELDRLDFSDLFKSSEFDGAQPVLSFERDNGSTRLNIRPNLSHLGRTVVLEQVDLYAELQVETHHQLMEKILFHHVIVC